MLRRSFLSVNLAFLVFCLATPVEAVTFKYCVAVIGNIGASPPDCSNMDHAYYDNVNSPPWCYCLITELSPNRANEFGGIQQFLVEGAHTPGLGKYTVTVNSGTLTLAELQSDQHFGQFLVDIPKTAVFPPLPENFILDFRMIVTELLDGNTAKFIMQLQPVNATTANVLTYVPTDEEHASGLIYTGEVTSFGENSGFELTFDYIPADELPPGATSTAIQVGDLTSPGFSVPIILNFPIPIVDPVDPSNDGKMLYKISPVNPLVVDTVIDQIFSDPGSPIRRTFSEEVAVEIPPTFRRLDANVDGAAGLPDVTTILGYLFQDGAAPKCLDAADVNDSGVVEIGDVIFGLYALFDGLQAPPPGIQNCGPDSTNNDTLAACFYDRC